MRYLLARVLGSKGELDVILIAPIELTFITDSTLPLSWQPRRLAASSSVSLRERPPLGFAPSVLVSSHGWKVYWLWKGTSHGELILQL